MPVTEEDDDNVLEWLADTLTKERACEEQNQWDPPPVVLQKISEEQNGRDVPFLLALRLPLQRDWR